MTTVPYADMPVMEIDLGRLVRNWQAVREHYTGTDLGAVVKCDAYGLGLEPVVATLSAQGCRQYWVLGYDEACRVRALAPDAEVFILSGLRGASAQDCLARRLIPVLNDLEEIAQARRAGALTVAVALDTGLGRLGLKPDAVERLKAQEWAPLRVRAWITQPASFSTPEDSARQSLHDRFLELIAPLPPAARCLAISASVFACPGHHLDMARVGSALYGVDTTPARTLPLLPVARVRAPVLQVADLPAGAEIGYDRQYRCPTPMRVATLCIGYAHGLPYALMNRGAVYFGPHRAPIVGGISMGLTSVDVSGLPDGLAAPGQWAEIFGEHQRLETLAALAGLPANALLSAAAAGCGRRYHAARPDRTPVSRLSESLP
ncbi:Alanine racemase [Castellaniella defragrans 65Phen]|uniref:Alanine racemase n=1 Tax=Castellaniella defragrans (strain DSM 12143 / CCUG 39792 / 65Phen) TaxID=1437824 RepID=W8WUP6_CASD6|nr:alanine racemase [Castellaniella defragrans]CDM23274.1 Alanine racemase [Castellaniella defragrans 65Phen]